MAQARVMCAFSGTLQKRCQGQNSCVARVDVTHRGVSRIGGSEAACPYYRRQYDLYDDCTVCVFSTTYFIVSVTEFRLGQTNQFMVGGEALGLALGLAGNIMSAMGAYT